jgi:hypothetical protein
VTPATDDALACGVEEASSSGEPKACWLALGALMKRLLAEAGGKQAMHRRWATQKPGVMLARCRALVGAVDTLLVGLSLTAVRLVTWNILAVLTRCF